MRFDDTLETVLAGDFSTPLGIQSAWRQLVDLIGRRRVYADPRALGLLRRIRPQIPVPVRAASARGLEFANPPASLVRLFAVDEIAIAIPVLRSARLTSSEWIEMLPELAPTGRAVLRNRRDLSPVVRRALESFGSVDFVLRDESLTIPVDDAIEAVLEQPVHDASLPEALVEPEAPVTDAPVEAEPEPEVAIVDAPSRPIEQWVDWTDVIGADETPLPKEPLPAIAPDIFHTPVAEVSEIELPSSLMQDDELVEIEEDFSFVELAGVAASLPYGTIFNPVVTAPVQSGTVEAEVPEEPIAASAEAAHDLPMAIVDTAVAEALEETPVSAIDMKTLLAGATVSDPIWPQDNTEIGFADGAGEGPYAISEVVARIDAFWRHREEGGATAPRAAPIPADNFRFETDGKGVIRWVEGVSRAPVVGLSLDIQGATSGMPEGSRVDGVASGAFRSRAGFSNARMSIEGESDATGDWLISAIPVFDPANGRFTGYRGTARRPRADERADPVRPAAAAATADSLRQLVHELRTPTNAIAGFAEMIETEMLGPVSDPYRDRANTIRSQARELLGAIDDLDLAARIDSDALSLVPAPVKLRPVLAGIADDLAPLAALRGSALSLPIDDLAVSGDRRAVERLLARLMATLVSASSPGESIGIGTALETDGMVTVTMDRPAALSDYPGDSVLGIDDEVGDSTLLGTGFALRLARNLARELGGSLVIEPESLTLRLPASVTAPVGQAHSS